MNVRQELEKLGYGLSMWKYSCITKRKHKYRTSPVSGGGCIGYFDKKEDVEKYIKNVRQVREWQDEVISNE